MAYSCLFVFVWNLNAKPFLLLLIKKQLILLSCIFEISKTFHVKGPNMLEIQDCSNGVESGGVMLNGV